MNKQKTRPAKRKKKLTFAQRVYFQSPIGKASRADSVIPPNERMGVKVNG